MAHEAALAGRARRALKEGRLQEADACCGELLRQHPDRPEWMVLRAQVAARLGNPAAACALLEHALAREPDLRDAWLGLATLHQGAGRHEAAAACYQRALVLMPGNISARFNLGVMLQRLGRLEESLLAYQAVLASDAGFTPARVNLGNVLLCLERWSEAEACYQHLAGNERAPAEVWHALGLAISRQGRFDEALSHYRRALGLNAGHTPSLLGIATVHHERGDLESAIEGYQRVLAVDPDHADALYGLARGCRESGRREDAAACLARLLMLRQTALAGHVRSGRSLLGPEADYAILYYDLGVLLKQLGNFTGWEANFLAFERDTQAAANAPVLIRYGLDVARHTGDVNREMACLARLEQIEFGPGDTGNLAALLSLQLYFDVAPALSLALYRRYDELMRARIEVSPLPAPGERRSGRIRVGYISPDLREHVMGRMVHEVLSRHDKTRFEVFGYSLNKVEDGLTARIRQACDGYVSLVGMASRAAAGRIREDDLDILVDLVTHTGDSRPEILAYKPARIQMTHIASAGAVGLSAIDFKLTDAYCDPPENQAFLVEQLLPMAGCVYPYVPIVPAGTWPHDRQSLSIPEDAFVLGVFVNLIKLSPRCLGVWRAVLERVPRARLAFSPLRNAEIPLYSRVLEAAGIPLNRVLFLPPGGNVQESLDRYSVVDAVLDPMPYGGVNGTLEPLSMGIPVVTLRGTRHGERTSYSILANLGVDGTIAESEEQYAAIVVRLADDPLFRSEVEAAIRRGMKSSPLVDMDRHVRNLEEAYNRAMGLKGFDPAGFDVCR